MKRILTLALLTGLLFVPSMTKAAVCNPIAADDGAGVMDTAQLSQVIEAAGPLINQGADVRVRAVGPTDNLDQTEIQYERNCPSWQGATGGRKNNLVVLMVSPKGRSMGIYYGSAFTPALGSGQAQRIRVNYMTPKFKDRDWVGGFVAAEQQLTARIAASKDETLHPATTVVTTTNQAADYTGLWSAFKIFLGIVTLALIGIGLYLYFAKKKREQDDSEAAQQDAIIARNMCTNRINSYKNQITTENQNAYDLAAEEFSRLMNSERTNPDTPGWPPQRYQVIGALYNKISRSLDLLVHPDVASAQRSVPKPEPEAKETAYSSSSYGRHSRSYYGESDPEMRATIIAPVIINNQVDESPAYEAPSSLPSRPFEDDNNSGGGSGSWDNSSSSGSSSGFDSESSFGSDSNGGSDSGGF